MKWDDFIEAHENDLKAEPDNLDLVIETMRFYFYINHWFRAKELALRIVDLNPNSDQGYFFLGYCESHLGNDRDAYDILEQAREKDPTNMDTYLLQLRLLIRNGVFETAHELVNFLHRCGASKEPVLQWCENLLYFYEKQDVMDNDMRGIIARYYELDELFAHTMTQDRADFYYHFALCIHQYEAGATDEHVISILNKGLEANPHDRNCLDFLGWLLTKMGEKEKAIAVYEVLKSFPGHELGTEVNLLDLYDPNMLPYMESVLDCVYAIEAQCGQNEEFHYYKGRYYYFLGKYDQAIFHFKKLRELAPDKMGGFRSLGFAYMAQGRYEEALELAEGALLLSEGWSNRKRYFLHKAQLERRLGRPYDAITTIQDMGVQCHEANVNPYLFEIYAQFGLWEDAKTLLDAWELESAGDSYMSGFFGASETNPGRAGWALASMKYALYMRDYFTAQSLRDQYHKDINPEDMLEVEQVLLAWKGDYHGILELWKMNLERYEKQQEEKEFGTPDAAILSYYEHGIARAYRILNQQERSISHANKGLKIMELGKNDFPNEEAMYETKHSGLRYLAGEEAQADKERNRVSKLPLCEHCNMTTCKDQKLFEIEAAYVSGDYATAMNLVQTYSLLWPDELEMILFENLMSISSSYLS